MLTLEWLENARGIVRKIEGSQTDNIRAAAFAMNGRSAEYRERGSAL